MQHTPIRIHIVGASGSGTTTLGAALGAQLGIAHLDTDDYFWLPTDPPFTEKRPIEERQRLLLAAMKRTQNWVVSGSMCGWSDFAIPFFDLVVFLWLPTEIRIVRIRQRERDRYGADIEPGGRLNAQHESFLEWAATYDAGNPPSRCLKLHEDWLATLPCPVIRIETDVSVEEKVRMVTG